MFESGEVLRRRARPWGGAVPMAAAGVAAGLAIVGAPGRAFG